MKTVRAVPNTDLSLGREGENAARKIEFDLSVWQAEFGADGTVALLHQPYGADEPYPAAVEVSGETATWVVTAADTAKAGAFGKAELQYRIGDTLAKSVIWRTVVADALGEPSPEPPEPQQAWVDQVLEAGAQADAAAKTAADAAAAASASASAAAGSADAAQDAASRGPKIQDGTWWVWDAAAGAYQDTGVRAQGETPAPVHLNLKDDFGVDLATAIFPALVTGQTEVKVPFAQWQAFFAEIAAAQGAIWVDIDLGPLGSVGTIYSSLITGITRRADGTPLWADTKISVYSGDWIGAYVGFGTNNIYVKITDAPTITSE